MIHNKNQLRYWGHQWVLIFTLVSVGFIFNIYGQEQEDTTSSKVKIPRNAFQFQIADNFQLSSFQGSVISLKRLISEKKAIRFGLSMNANISDDDGESFVTQDSLLSTSQSDHSTYGITVSALYLYSPYKTSGIAFFIGAGPFFGYNFTELENRDVSYRTFIGDTVTARQLNTTKEYVVGIIGVFGVQWFLKEKLSLTAEYGLDVHNNWRNVEMKLSQKSVLGDNEVRHQNRDSNSFVVQPLAVKFGVSIYF